MDAATHSSSSIRSQRVVFIRHGVAQHNVVQSGQTINLQSEDLWDTSLVPEGKRQAVAVGEAVTQALHSIELVVVSPLTRCLQTATLAFPPPGSYSSPPTQFVCHEMTREAYGVHYPDKRRSATVLKVRSYMQPRMESAL